MNTAPLEQEIRESIATKQRLLDVGLEPVGRLLEEAAACIQRGGKLLLCGNGGSSCDAAHAAGELIGWFLAKNRGPIPAIALGHEIPALTAIANDSGYEDIFARQLQALGKPEDLLIGITTSGGSKNIAKAIQVAKDIGLYSVALTGSKPGPCGELADLWLPMPSTETPRIQECHLLVMHLLCAHLERTIA
jgi:D-sedoheptulose 7-phosphate isomerase